MYDGTLVAPELAYLRLLRSARSLGCKSRAETSAIDCSGNLGNARGGKERPKSGTPAQLVCAELRLKVDVRAELVVAEVARLQNQAELYTAVPIEACDGAPLLWEWAEVGMA